MLLLNMETRLFNINTINSLIGQTKKTKLEIASYLNVEYTYFISMTNGCLKLSPKHAVKIAKLFNVPMFFICITDKEFKETKYLRSLMVKYQRQARVIGQFL